MPEIARSLTDEEQAAFFFSLVDSTADAIIAHRPDGSVVYANSGAAELLGYDQEQMLELAPYAWVAPSQLQSAPRRLQRILHDGTITFESAVRHSDGRVIQTEVRTRRVDTPLGPMMVAVIRDVSERVRNREMLEHLAYFDALTGLSNRSHLEDRLSLAIADARRYDDDLALAYVDLDHFKPVNDRFGHATGDRVLIEVATRLRRGVRTQDTVARLGGDEFVILFPRVSLDGEIERISDRLIHDILKPIDVGHHQIRVGASIGLALFDPSEDDSRSLIVKADRAMYAAKNDPDHDWLRYTPDMEPQPIQDLQTSPEPAE
jgi:diguanylate cyclase (GGDEF)-like protein/PAS domain S-box-containing protein